MKNRKSRGKRKPSERIKKRKHKGRKENVKKERKMET